MTIEKTERLQDELRTLFRKFNISGATVIFVHADTAHFVEVHVTERNQWVIAITDALSGALKATHPNIPVVDFNNAQGN